MVRNRIIDETAQNNASARARAEELKKQHPDCDVLWGYDYTIDSHFVRVYEDDRTGEDVEYDRKTGRYL